MTASLRKDAEEEPQAPLHHKPKPDIYDMLARMLIGFLVNYLTRKIRQKSDASGSRKKAAKKMGKLAKKGKEIPPEVKEEALAGLSRHKKKKVLAAGAKKAARAKGRKEKKKKKRGKLFWVVAIAIVIGLAVRAANKK